MPSPKSLVSFLSASDEIPPPRQRCRVGEFHSHRICNAEEGGGEFPRRVDENFVVLLSMPLPALLYPLLPDVRAPKVSSFFEQFPREKFVNSQEAAASAREAWWNIRGTIGESTPLPLDEPLFQKSSEKRTRNEQSFAGLSCYYKEDGRWLRACGRNIVAALQAGDEAFFLKLAELIRGRPIYRGKSLVAFLNGWVQANDPRPIKRRTSEFRQLIVDKWMDWGLWLMPDSVVASFLTKFSGVELTAGSFTKLRQEMKLVQHPDHPVRSYTTKGELRLRKGWKNTKP